MKISEKSLFLSTLAALAQLNIALAGNITSGGGGAFVCRDSAGKIVDSELLDIWEGREIEQLAITETNQPFRTQIKAAVGRIALFDSDLAKEVQENLKFLESNTVNLSSSVALPPPDDANPIFQKPGCPLSGMMYFDGTRKKLFIDPKVFNALLSETEKAAAWLHEAVYKTLRESWPAATDSVGTRLFIARLFADDLPTTPLVDKWPATGPIEKCLSTKVVFYRGKYTDVQGTEVTRFVFEKFIDTLYPNGVILDSKINKYGTMNCLGGPLIDPYWAGIVLPTHKIMYSESDSYCVDIGTELQFITSYGVPYRARNTYNYAMTYEPLTCTTIRK